MISGLLKNKKLLPYWFMLVMTVCLILVNPFWSPKFFSRDVSILSKLSPSIKTSTRQKLKPGSNEILNQKTVTENRIEGTDDLEERTLTVNVFALEVLAGRIQSGELIEVIQKNGELLRPLIFSGFYKKIRPKELYVFDFRGNFKSLDVAGIKAIAVKRAGIDDKVFEEFIRTLELSDNKVTAHDVCVLNAIFLSRNPISYAREYRDGQPHRYRRLEELLSWVTGEAGVRSDLNRYPTWEQHIRLVKESGVDLEDPLVVASLAYWFMTVSDGLFEDGSHRTAFYLMNVFLKKAGYPRVSYWREAEGERSKPYPEWRTSASTLDPRPLIELVKRLVSRDKKPGPGTEGTDSTGGLEESELASEKMGSSL